MGKISIILALAFIALVLSSGVEEPSEVTELRNAAWGLNCTSSVCIVSKAQIGAWVDAGLLEKTKGEVLNGTVKEALAFLLAKDDSDVREKFRSEIDDQISKVKLGETPSDDLLLIENELKFRLKNASNERYVAEFNQIRDWLLENGTRDFLYVYSIDSFKEDAHKNISGANLSNPAAFMLSMEQSPVNFEIIGPSTVQNFLAQDIKGEMRTDPQEKLAEDVCAMSFYYSMLYPSLMIKDSIFGIMTIYALPLAIICWISVLSYFTSGGKGKSSRFQRDYSKNVILTALLAAIIFPLLINLSLLFPLFPAAIYLIFILPILMPTFYYIWSSTNLLKDYGLVKVSRENFLIARYKESILIAAGGALIALISIFIMANIQRIFAYMSMGLVSALAVLSLLILFSIFVVILFPRFIEFTSSSMEIRSKRMKKRLKGLADKFGYNADSIRVIPSAGSNLANAFQSGLVGSNVKLFIFETLLDERKFSERELEAVVAHELAHIRKKHVLKTVFGYLVIACGVIALFIILSLLFEAANFGTAREILAVSGPYVALAVAFLATMYMMRSFEFEADAAAAEMGYREDLISALKKIDKHNLTPSTLSRFVTIFSSHADLESRIRNLRKEAQATRIA